MFFKKKKLIEEQSKTIAELREKIDALQKQLDSANARLDVFQQREQAICRAITDAEQTADRIVTDAQKESDDIHDSAQREYIAAQKKGETVIQTAYENARDIVKEAERTSEQKIKETDDAVAAYVQLLNEFNDTMKEQARQAEDQVKKISDYYTRLNRALPELFGEIPQLSDSLEKRDEEPLPDPEGDPAQLMRNIYTIENRYLPHDDIPDRTSTPPEDAEQTQRSNDISDEPPSERVPVPSFEGEEESVVRVSDIVSEDVGTIDTDELIAKTAAMGSHPLKEQE